MIKFIHEKDFSKGFVFFSIFFLLPVFLSSQNSPIIVTSPIVMPVTPEASAMAKYVSSPVNYSTGKVEISIPLYEITVGDIVLPITLFYDMTGLKPKEYSGRIATNWTLNAEPSIMRYVKGIADEEIYGYLNTVFNPYANNDYLREIYNGMRDEEPDEFHYQLASEGGTCYISTTDKSLMIPYPFREDKIETNGLNGIRITDSNGIRYEFGNNINSKELTNTTPTRWMCDRIFSSATYAQILFDYIPCTKPSPSICSLNDYVIVEDLSTHYSRDIKMTDSKDGINNLYLINSSGESSYLETNTVFGQYNKYASAILKGQNLNHIYFDNGTITFTWDTFTLTKMEVHDKENNLIKTVQFYSSKYNYGTELTKLDSLVISKDGILERQVFKFFYNRPEFVPPMVTKNVDHWGFFNDYYNPDDNSSSVPISNIFSKQFTSSHDSVAHTIGGRSRESNDYFSQQGILNNIIYPSGMEKYFTYEGNITRYMSYTLEPGGYPFGGEKFIIPVRVGGLRIKRINEYDPITGISRTKELTYTNFMDQINYENEGHADDGYGIVRKIVSSEDYCHTQSNENVIYCDNNNIRTRLRTWGSIPLSTITYNDGSIIYYDHVIERETTNDNDTSTLLTKYYYDTPYLPDFKYKFEKRDVLIPFDVPSSNSFQETTLLRKVEKYRRDTLVASNEYIYEIKNANNIDYRIETAKTYQTQIYMNGENCTTQKDEYNRLIWYSNNSWMQLKNETKKEYYEGKIIDITKNYFYQTTPKIYHKKPIKITTSTSRGETVEDHYRFCTDILENYPENIQGQLVQFNIHSVPVEYKHIGGVDTAYTRSVYAGVQIQQIKTKIKAGPDFVSRIFYNRYDAYGNLVDVSENDGIHTCYIWSYNNQSPIAKIENITYSELLAALGKNDLWITDLGNKIKPTTEDFILINSLRTKLPNSLITTYTYKPLTGVLSITDPRSATTYFEYDPIGRLKKTYVIENGTTRVVQENTYKLTR